MLLFVILSTLPQGSPCVGSMSSGSPKHAGHGTAVAGWQWLLGPDTEAEGHAAADVAGLWELVIFSYC